MNNIIKKVKKDYRVSECDQGFLLFKLVKLFLNLFYLYVTNNIECDFHSSNFHFYRINFQLYSLLFAENLLYKRNLIKFFLSLNFF